MNDERTARIIAAAGTVIIALLMVLMLSCTYLSMPFDEEIEKDKGEIVLVDEEEFIEVIEPESISPMVDEKEAASYLDEPQHNESQPTPAAGTDLVDNSPKGEPTPVVTSKEPSEVKQKVEKPKNQGSTTDQKAKEQEEIKRAANNEVANAFKNSSGKHNSATASGRDEGLNGERTSNKDSQGTTGTGAGKVGGGWIIPKYAPVRSNYTGSVKMIVKIDKTGKVISVTFNGGEPPAATDTRVQAAIEREIRAHKFSRSSYSDAEEATAYITYTFR